MATRGLVHAKQCDGGPVRTRVPEPVEHRGPERRSPRLTDFELGNARPAAMGTAALALLVPKYLARRSDALDRELDLVP